MTERKINNSIPPIKVFLGDGCEADIENLSYTFKKIGYETIPLKHNQSFYHVKEQISKENLSAEDKIRKRFFSLEKMFLMFI